MAMAMIGRRTVPRLGSSSCSESDASAASQDSTEGDLNLSAARSTNWVLARPRSNSTYGPGDTYLPTTYLLGGDKLRVHSLTSSAFCTIFNGDAPDFLAQTNPSKSKRANDDHLPNTQPLRNITTEHSSFLSCSDFPFSLVATSDLLLFLPCDRRTGHFCRSSSREQEGDQTPGQQPRLNRHPLGHCELTGRIFSASPIRLI